MKPPSPYAKDPLAFRVSEELMQALDVLVMDAARCLALVPPLGEKMGRAYIARLALELGIVALREKIDGVPAVAGVTAPDLDALRAAVKLELGAEHRETMQALDERIKALREGWDEVAAGVAADRAKLRADLKREVEAENRAMWASLKVQLDTLQAAADASWPVKPAPPAEEAADPRQIDLLPSPATPARPRIGRPPAFVEKRQGPVDEHDPERRWPVRVSVWLKARGMTAKGLALALCLNPTTVQRWLKGEKAKVPDGLVEYLRGRGLDLEALDLDDQVPHG